MLGIGITTFNRYKILNLCLEQIAKHTKVEHRLFVYDDTLTQKGVAYGKNQCINTLYNQGCTDFFLFDDDCFPIKYNWHIPFIDSHFKHLIYATKKEHNYLASINVKNDDTLSAKYFEGSAGCFLYFTKEVVDTIGYFNEQYYLYGFEHAGYSRRIYNAGLTQQSFICLNTTKENIHSLDIDGSFNGYENTITLEKEVKHACIFKNKEIYLQEINSDQLYYPYNQK
jgi:GT2 family glycosyltransferase